MWQIVGTWIPALVVVCRIVSPFLASIFWPFASAKHGATSIHSRLGEFDVAAQAAPRFAQRVVLRGAKVHFLEVLHARFHGEMVGMQAAEGLALVLELTGAT